MKGADAAAHTLAKVGGFTNGASLGYLGGALLAGTMGCSGGSSFALALAVGGVSGVAGWKVMDKVSDWAAREGARLVPGPLGEAGGRVALNLGMDLLSGNRLTAIADLGITGGYGLYKMARA